MHHRSWFPVILAGASLMLFAIFAFVARPHGGGEFFTETVPKSEPVTEDGYKMAVTSILQAYQTDKKAEAAYNALILLHVPPTHLQMHLDLVVALGKIIAKDTEEGRARLDILKVQNSWLPL